MRLFSLTKSLLFACFVSVFASSIFANDLPQGSYLKTCYDCFVEAEQLYCDRCLPPFGYAQESMLVLPCSKSIVNFRAELKCMDESIPLGSYQESCTDCTLTEGSWFGPASLTCLCSKDGEYIKTSTFLDCGPNYDDILNIHGVLKQYCELEALPSELGSGSSGAYPSGAYPSGSCPFGYK